MTKRYNIFRMLDRLKEEQKNFLDGTAIKTTKNEDDN